MELTIEEKMAKLEELVNKLENEKMTLKESLELYESAMTLSKELTNDLNLASKKVKMIKENNEIVDFE
jgi:exodeoxyribonuclease VII small subunit